MRETSTVASGTATALYDGHSDHLPFARHYSALEAAVQRARQELYGTLVGAWQLSPDVADDAVMALSELFTNAVRHIRFPPLARLRVDARLQRDEDGTILLRLGVTDTDRASAKRVQPRRIDPDTLLDPEALPEGGRGLSIVENLARRWGVTEVATGKTVWCELIAA